MKAFPYWEGRIIRIHTFLLNKIFHSNGRGEFTPAPLLFAEAEALCRKDDKKQGNRKKLLPFQMALFPLIKNINSTSSFNCWK